MCNVNSKNICGASSSQQLIWHYTDVNCFLALMERNSAMYATLTEFCNDPNEIIYGCERISELANKLQECINTPINVKEVVQKYREMYDVFVSCFSCKTEKYIDLNQWRSYTNIRQGGYAIGFSKQDIETILSVEDKGKSVSFALTNNNKDSYKLTKDAVGGLRFIGKCIYDEQAQEQFFRKALQCQHQNGYFFNIELIVALCSALFKKNIFCIEDEERIVYIQRHDQRNNCFIFDGKPRIKTHFTNIRSYVKEVVVSPWGNTRYNKDIAKFISSQCEKPFEVIDSDILQQ